MYSIHWGLVILTAVINFGVGFAWYGPLFGKKWMGYMGINPNASMGEKGSMMRSMIINLICQALTAVVFFTLAANTYAMGFSALFSLALWILVGFQLPILVGEVLWNKKPWGLFILNGAYQLAILVVAALVYSFWM